MSKKKATPTVMPKTEAERNRLTVTLGKVATGHQSHISGTGAATRRAIGEW